MKTRPIRRAILRGILTALLAGTTSVTSALAQLSNLASKVPQFRFGSTLKIQEAELQTNAFLLRMKDARRKLAQDPHRPIYHFVNPEGNLNDPNGLCFWQGRWHLFYQAYPPEDPRQHWGHAVSTDLIHWRDLPLAIYPDPEHRVFSGSTLVESNRVIAAYHGTTTGTMIAVSSDPLLLNWEKLTGGAVIPLPNPDEPPPPYFIYDPCIWKQGDHYYVLSGSTISNGPGGRANRANYLFRSKNLTQWEYLHEFTEGDRYSLLGDDGACPYFWPIGDRHVLLHFSHMSGGKYLLGDYDTRRDKFVVTDGGNFNHGAAAPGGVHAPSAFPDGKGGVIAIFNMNPAKPTRGWNQIMTLPMRLTLTPSDEVDRLRIEPAGDIESLRGRHTRIKRMTLPANKEVVLESVKGNSMEIMAEIDLKGSPLFELNVLRSPSAEEFTRITVQRGRGFAHREYKGIDERIRQTSSVITLDNSRSSMLPDVSSRPPESAQFMLGGRESLKLRVFIDRSVVEVFANGRQFAALRVYPGREDSVGVSLRSQGRDAEVLSFDAWQMSATYR